MALKSVVASYISKLGDTTLLGANALVYGEGGNQTTQQQVSTDFKTILPSNDNTSYATTYNSSGEQLARTYGDGRSVFISKTTSPEGVVDFYNFAGQGIDGTRPGAVFHNYTDSTAVQIDMVGTGTLLNLVNASNPTNRPDKPIGYYGTGQYIRCSDENGLFFRWYGTNREQEWVDGTWKMSNIATGEPIAFHWNVPNVNTAYYRWTTPNTYAEINEFNISTDYGSEIKAYGNAGLKLNAVNGNIITDNLPTSNVGLPTGAWWNDGGTLKIAA